MTFEYGGRTFNLLDTPGHEDFSEDTYRTLTAVDSAVMVIDAAKGIEAQTRKLFEVCRLRDVPIITFVNKLDREGRDPFELLDEIEQTLQLEVTAGGHLADRHGTALSRLLRPLAATASAAVRPGSTWPRGRGLRGLDGRQALDRATAGRERWPPARGGGDGARGSAPSFDLETYLEGHMTPVYFGSALNNFGVRELCSTPSPRWRRRRGRSPRRAARSRRRRRR